MVSTPPETIDLRIQKGAKKQDYLLLTLCLLLTHRRVVLCPYALQRPTSSRALCTVSGTAVGRGMSVGDPPRYRCQPAGLPCRYRGVGESRMARASIERHSRE